MFWGRQRGCRGPKGPSSALPCAVLPPVMPPVMPWKLSPSSSIPPAAPARPPRPPGNLITCILPFIHPLSSSLPLHTTSSLLLHSSNPCSDSPDHIHPSNNTLVRQSGSTATPATLCTLHFLQYISLTRPGLAAPLPFRPSSGKRSHLPPPPISRETKGASPQPRNPLESASTPNIPDPSSTSPGFYSPTCHGFLLGGYRNAQQL